MSIETSIEARLLDWVQSGDTGSSSKAIAAFMQGRKSDGSFPWDGADFGRCHRLLQLIPEWRERLPEMAEKFPQWSRLVAIWPELEKLYGDGSDAGNEAAVHKRMKSAVNASEPKFKVGQIVVLTSIKKEMPFRILFVEWGIMGGWFYGFNSKNAVAESSIRKVTSEEVG